LVIIKKEEKQLNAVINNGFIIDPKNKIYSKLDVSIANGKIIEISKNIW
jgi:formylmethanofuran dehydrogenase subunit A